MTTISELVNQISSKSFALPQLAKALDTAALFRNPALAALSSQSSAMTRIAESHAAALGKLQADLQKSVQFTPPSLKALTQQASEMQHLARSIGPDASLLKSIAESHSAAIGKLQADLQKSMQFTPPSLKALTQQASEMQHLARSISPSASLLKAVDESQRQITRSLERLSKNATLLQAQQLGFPSVKLIPSLPNIRKLVAIQERDVRGHKVLDETGYEFVYQVVGGAFAAELSSVSPVVRGAAVTNRLLSFTKSKSFEIELAELFAETPILLRRWPIVQQALQAHRRREYWVSVPVLMSQLEGLISEALVLRSIAKKSKGKFYELDSQGRPRKNRNGLPIELRGLASKIKKFSLAGSGVLQGVIDLVDLELAGRRNLVLHGSDIRYGKAKLSIQLLLSTYLWATEIAAFVT